MSKDGGTAPLEPVGTEPVRPARPPGRGGADQPAAVVDPERFARQFRIGTTVVVVVAILVTIGAVLAVSVFR